MKKTMLIVAGVAVAIIVVVVVVLLSGKEEKSSSKQNGQQEQSNTSQTQDTSGSGKQEVQANGEIIGQTDINGIPIPEFSFMKEVATNQKEGDSFAAVYNVNPPEEEAIKNFYQNNLGEDWILEEEQTSGGQTVYIFSKGENYNLKVAITEDGVGASGEGSHGIAIDYTAPYQEDPYPDAVGSAPTSDEAEKFHETFSSMFENIFGGVKLNYTAAEDWISFDYIVKRPITQEDSTEIRSQMEDNGYDTQKVSKDKHKTNYTFRLPEEEGWNEVKMTINVGEYISDVQKIDIRVYQR
ncbi:MAG: hypothetical protein U5L10_02735 [Candidatus Moranbacteria bacterium]|nr:hypothetical protein [Candidatus Moranbacteria bacterium]